MRTLINFKIAFRSILKNKIQSLVSIVGLGIGLGCVLLITLLYLHENSFDQHIPNNKQVYRVIHGDNCGTPFPFGEMVANEIPSVETYFRYYQIGEFDIRNSNNEIHKEKQFSCSDHDCFDCFGIDMIVGRPAQSIFEVAISEKMAKKYFNDVSVINQMIEARLNNDFVNLTICGVYKDFPSNASLRPNFISHTDIMDEMMGTRKKLLGEYGIDNNNFKTNWNRSDFHTYIKINAQSDALVVAEQLQKYKEQFENEEKQQKAFSLQNVTDVYLRSDNVGGDQFSGRGNSTELIYYLAIAIFIIIIAVFNYIFHTKAKMNGRLKELGAKKAFGASTLSVRKQLLLESNIISLISLIPAIVVVIAGMPFINDTLGSTLDDNILWMWYTVPVLILITVFVGSVSGLFVGVKISRVSPVLLLNKKTSAVSQNHKWGNAFLSIHFIIFIVLIVGVLTLKKQINYALTNFTAIDPKNVIICELNTPELMQKFDVIKADIDQIPGVINSAGSSFIPPFNWTLPISLQNEGETVKFDGLIMGQGMTNLLGLEFIGGSSFDTFQSGSTNIIINESAALKYDLQAGGIFNGFNIKGVVKDFTAHSLRQLIQPMVIIQQNPKKMRLFAIKTTGENDELIKETATKLLKEISPNKNPEIYTLTEQINKFYTREQNQAKLISSFSLLAIVLSVMGLLGMVMNTVSRQRKEIGIRKVNGAKVSEILSMLNKDFIKWVAIAFVVACPIAYYAMNKWLENFAYKTSLSWWIFALAGLLALGIALLTVSWQSWRAATRNPVEALRYE